MTAGNEPAAEPHQEPATAPDETVVVPPSSVIRGKMSAERLAAEIARLDRLLVVALLAFAFLLGSFAARNSDFWMHLATGRALLRGPYTFGTDPFSYTTAGVYWANHSWLYDGLLYAVTQALGGIDGPAAGAVLVAGKALLAALLAGLLLAIRRRRQSIWLPVVCVALGMLVLSPRLYLQPTIFSFLGLGLTLYFLAREGKPTREPTTKPLGLLRTSAPARLYALPPLFLLWVNLDSWFLLGPMLLALGAIGDFLQEKLAPLRTAEDTPQPGEGRAQLMALGLGLAACLVNPHHYRAFALPPDLWVVLQPLGLREDPWFQGLFISPLAKDYFTASAGYTLAGLAYFALVGMGILSFGMNSAGTRGWRTLIWLVFCLLSAANQRFIPFFAIVAGPIAALNFQDYLADRLEAALPTHDFGRVRGLVGRGLTLLALVLLMAGTWFGLPHANADNRQYARRVTWAVEADPSMRKAAEQLAVWRQTGQLPAGSRGFASNADLPNYFAWFCPAEKGFFDYRYPLFPEAVPDFVAIRRWLEGRPGREPDWRRTLRARHIDHVILTGSQFNGKVAQLLQFPREWPLLYLDGRTAMFGWNDPALGDKTDRFAATRFDPNPRAFGPNPDRAPAEGMPRPPRRADEWERYWQSPLPPSLDSDEAFADLLYFEAVKQQWQDARLSAVIQAGLASFVSVGGSGTGPAATGTALAERLDFAEFLGANRGQRSLRGHGGELVARSLREQDQGPPAAPLLALRAARRALAANPDDAAAHLGLAHAAYHLWINQENYWAGSPSPGPIVPKQLTQLRQILGQRSMPVGPFLSRWITRSVNRRQMLRQVQVVTALQHTLLLQPNTRQAHDMLADLYWHMGYYDLALEHLRAALEQVKAAAPEEGSDRKKEYDLRMGRQEQFVKEVEKEVEELRNDYELHAANLPPPQRRLLAFAPFGLARLALTSLEEADVKQLTAQEADLFVYLMATTGQASKVYDETTGKPGRLPEAENVKKALGRQFAWSQALLSAAVGDYALANHALDQAQPSFAPPASPPLADMLQAMTFDQLHLHPFGRLVLAPFLGKQFAEAQMALARRQGLANFLVLRGLVALDEGDVEAARRHFQAALRATEFVPPFESRPIALRYSRLLDTDTSSKRR